MHMKDQYGGDYAKHPSGGGARGMVQWRMEDEGTIERLDPEQARRILTEEMPRRIERLRREFLNACRGERGRRRRDDREEQAA